MRGVGATANTIVVGHGTGLGSSVGFMEGKGIEVGSRDGGWGCSEVEYPYDLTIC